MTHVRRAAPRTCYRDLVKGEVKRCLARGPLVGYWICCPACGRTNQYLDSQHGFSETTAGLSMARAATCYGCAGAIMIANDELVLP